MSAHAGTHTRASDQGPIAEVCADDVLAALRLARTGRVYDLEVERFRGMPLHPAHPQMEILTFRFADAQGVEVRPKDTVLVRTGYTGLYPDTERMAEHAGSGIDPSAAAGSWTRPLSARSAIPRRSSRFLAQTQTTRTPCIRSCLPNRASTSPRWQIWRSSRPTRCTSSRSSRCRAGSAALPVR
ncbi:MAG: cyclase family protein [Solirubrobacterales bacterium]|nr:cyclase family protein [Solirubrobacterales bacterium]